MADINYVLQYLPSFYEDLENHTVYIAEKLQNPQAANELIDAVENAIFKRKPNAEAFERYHSINERKYPYYRIYVKNYIIYSYFSYSINQFTIPKRNNTIYT